MNTWQKGMIALALIAVLALGTGLVLAQDTDQPVTPPAFGPGSGPMMGQGFGQGFGRTMMAGFSLVDVTAEALGLPVDEVLAELNAGLSIADLAAKYEADVQEIVDAALAQHEAALAAAVSAGTLTQEQADLMQEHMAGMIAWRVEQPWSAGGYGGMMGGYGGGMMGGRGGRFAGGFGGCHGGGFGPGQSTAPNSGTAWGAGA